MGNMIQLRPYQQEAHDAIMDKWQAGANKLLLVLPTGCGKTIVFSTVTRDRVMQGSRVLILAHRGELLEQAAAQLPLEYQPVVLEDLAKTYISLQDLTSDNSYTRKAVSTLERVVQNGWANILTYNNLIVLYQRLDELEEANRYAGKMTELYPERYETYKRLAFLDVSIQEKKPNEERDYTAFREHYQKAEELAKQQLGSNQQDMEMEILRDAFEQMNAEGWF